jgi:hypothetical protein
MQRYAIIQGENVVNVIEYESQPSNPPPAYDDTYIAVQSNEASVGWTYQNGIFIAPQPYPSWELINNVWTSPVAMPDDGKSYLWNEQAKNWESLNVTI